VGQHSDVVNPDQLMEISTSHNEVKDILNKLDVNKVTGVDGLPARILKECAEELSYPLTVLFNLSFGSSRVPSLWKKANVTPVFKSGTKDMVENYRSTSLLSSQVNVRRISYIIPFILMWLPIYLTGNMDL